MNISLSQLITGTLTIPELLEQAKRAGYDEVELSLHPAADAPLNYQTSDSNSKNTANRLHKPEPRSRL